jgi:hypothetical protein
MKICGVELQANDVIISILELDRGLYEIHPCRVTRFQFRNANSTAEIRKFQFDFKKLMEDYKIDTAVIRQRPLKGKFAGGAVGFKLETAIQLIDGIDVEILSTTQIKEFTKHANAYMPFAETGLKKFQEPAYNTAFAYLHRPNDFGQEV